jgi:hypothetical protein
VELSVIGTDEPRLRAIFDGLADGGTVRVPLAKQFWGDTFGAITEKYGIGWQVNIGLGTWVRARPATVPCSGEPRPAGCEPTGLGRGAYPACRSVVISVGPRGAWRPAGVGRPVVDARCNDVAPLAVVSVGSGG